VRNTACDEVRRDYVSRHLSSFPPRRLLHKSTIDHRASSAFIDSTGGYIDGNKAFRESAAKIKKKKIIYSQNCNSIQLRARVTSSERETCARNFSLRHVRSHGEGDPRRRCTMTVTHCTYVVQSHPSKASRDDRSEGAERAACAGDTSLHLARSAQLSSARPYDASPALLPYRRLHWRACNRTTLASTLRSVQTRLARAPPRLFMRARPARQPLPENVFYQALSLSLSLSPLSISLFLIAGLARNAVSADSA